MVNNLPVKTLVHKDLTIEGYSRAAVQTYWRMPELKIGFDLGAQPWSFMGTPTWFVSHTHMDHLIALPVYVARRRMMKMEPPTIYLPEAADRADAAGAAAVEPAGPRPACPARWCRPRPGDEIELSREHVVTVSATTHTVPSLGFVVWERRRKLKPEYQGLAGRQDPRSAPRRHGSDRRGPPAAGGLPGRQLAGRAGRLPGHVRGRSADHGTDVRLAASSQGEDPQVRPHAPRRSSGASRAVPQRAGHRLATSAPATIPTRSAIASRRPCPTCSTAGCTCGSKRDLMCRHQPETQAKAAQAGDHGHDPIAVWTA